MVLVETVAHEEMQAIPAMQEVPATLAITVSEAIAEMAVVAEEAATEEQDQILVLERTATQEALMETPTAITTAMEEMAFT